MTKLKSCKTRRREFTNGYLWGKATMLGKKKGSARLSISDKEIINNHLKRWENC